MSIPASYDTLMRQAPATAALYMREGAQEIDQLFGKGYAKANPLLLATFMLTSAFDLASATIGKEIGENVEQLGRHLADIGASIGSVAEALGEAAEE